jgi:hypothetical protein
MGSAQNATIKALRTIRIHVKKDDSGNVYEEVVDTLNMEEHSLHSNVVNAPSMEHMPNSEEHNSRLGITLLLIYNRNTLQIILRTL